MSFRKLLEDAVKDGIGVCVGLDPVIDRLPENIRASREPLLNFNLDIIEATSDIVSAYKPNLAFYEVFGAEGWHQLEMTIKAIPAGKVVIADGKRGDIGNTGRVYAKSLFDTLGCNATTVNPYLGSDSIQPFIEREDKGVYVLAVTSNPGSADVQELSVDGLPVYRHVIRMLRNFVQSGNIGLVVGATKPDILPDLLQDAVDMPLLIPGVGAQGGNVELLRTLLRDYKAPVLVNASRSIIYASQGDDFKEAARLSAVRLFDQLTK